MSTPSKYPSSTEAHKAGWFSRRHQTRGPHDAARATYQGEQAEKLAHAKAQNEAAAARKAAGKA